MTDIENKNYIIALDQGTTSSRAIIFDRDANVVCTAQREFTQHYPQAGWVEHDPMEIFATQSAVMVEALAQAGLHHDQVAAIGITNQRETTVVWDKITGSRSTTPSCGSAAAAPRSASSSSVMATSNTSTTPPAWSASCPSR